ncbi:MULTISPECIES: molybdopterin converting factor subunit 1 [Sulfuricystis]|uniref:molybdopterin converting factor subunit 1 n=1 Tax=Sulfuricystis TaxID=3050898 RepID=UPI000F83202A|nr:MULTISPECIES: molybdopterin converting factor subunit 1 [Sulfuricystis]
MTLKVLYFASLSEAIGLAAETIDLPPGGTTVGALRQTLGARHPALLTTKNLRAAVNRQMCGWEAPVEDGDEVAFFPPVTGG